MRKTRIGSFINSPDDVNTMLKKRGIDALVLTGVITGTTVFSSVTQARDLDYRLYVLGDGCWILTKRCLGY